MAIKFDSLPDSIAGGQKIPKGTYYGIVEKAEMKQGKDTTKPPYLNLMIKVSNAQGTPVGTLWDIISESTNQYAQYKLKRFIIALGINTTPDLELELKDLVKIAPQTKLLLDITQDKEDKNQVDIFSGDVYYHISEAEAVLGTDNIFIDATDAEDATVFPTQNNNVEY